MGECLQTTVGEQATLQRGFDITKAEQEPGPYPVVSSGGASSFHKEAKVKGPGVVLGRKGVVGSVYYVPTDFWPHDTTLWVKDFHSNLPRFVYYFFRWFAPRLAGMDVGTSNPTLNRNHVHPIPISWPSFPEQERVASLLGALDDKIELNRRTNETLEAMARAFFKDWFVDFGPTLAKMEGREPYLAPDLWSLFPDALDDTTGLPEGWCKRSIYEFSDVVYGAPFASKEFKTDGTGVPLIRIRDLATHEPGISTSEVHSKGHMIEPGDIVVGMDGEFRLHIWKGPNAWLNQRVCHFEPKSGVPKSYLAEALREPLGFFELGKVGTTVIHLGKSDIDTFKLTDPTGSVLSAFADLVEHSVEQAVRNALESRSLAQTRDLLLPKLMSGEIRLRDAEKLAEEAA